MRTLPFSKNDMAAPFPGLVCANACGTAAAAAAATPVASTVRLVESMSGSFDERTVRADDIFISTGGAIMRIAYRLLAAVLAAIVGIPVLAQQTPYRLEEGWGKLPDGRKWGNTSGVDLDRHGNIWVVERCGRPHAGGSTPRPDLELAPAWQQVV